jgi:hypothetical protein
MQIYLQLFLILVKKKIGPGAGAYLVACGGGYFNIPSSAKE